MADCEVIIYALCEPGTMEIRYIGKTINVERRYGEHLQPHSLSEPTHKNAWLRNVLSNGGKPELMILEVLRPGADWKTQEKWWIAWGRHLCWQLTNSTDGGDGVVGLVFTEEYRAKLARAKVGTSNAKGHRKSEQTKAHLSVLSRGNQYAKGYKHTEEARAKMTGKKHSEEHRKKNAEAKRLWWALRKADQSTSHA